MLVFILCVKCTQKIFKSKQITGGEVHCGPCVRNGLTADKAFAEPSSVGRCDWAERKGEGTLGQQYGLLTDRHSYWNRAHMGQ